LKSQLHSISGCNNGLQVRVLPGSPTQSLQRISFSGHLRLARPLSDTWDVAENVAGGRLFDAFHSRRARRPVRASANSSGAENWAPSHCPREAPSCPAQYQQMTRTPTATRALFLFFHFWGPRQTPDLSEQMTTVAANGNASPGINRSKWAVQYPLRLSPHEDQISPPEVNAVTKNR
jgi:hypothetical protein